MMPHAEPSDTQTLINDLITAIEKVIRGKRPQIEQILTCLLAGGHILMEDNPGTGKTVLARTLAGAINGGADENRAVFKRIQFTPDLLPMDIIGNHIFDEELKEFLFKKGPIFCNILLADEINRASPKVQSALLEAMAEHQVTVGETTLPLEKVFFTIATQNPVEMEGTYPLPAAQLDRFFMKIYFGYVDEVTELDIYRNYLDISRNLNEIRQVIDLDTLMDLQSKSSKIFIHDELVRGVNHIVRETRVVPDIRLGASTRSGIAFLKCLKAYALIRGRDYVIEDDLHDLAHPILHHRLIFRTREARDNSLRAITEKEITRLARLKLYA